MRQDVELMAVYLRVFVNVGYFQTSQHINHIIIQRGRTAVSDGFKLHIRFFVKFGESVG